MAPPDAIEPEEFWSEVLSEDPARVQDALRILTRVERAGVRVHLQAMAEDAGWSTGQRRRARAALVAIQDTEPD
jgi:hypothetical protein